MPTGYDEIPGVYSASPRPMAGIRRNLRQYRWCMGAIGFTFVVIVLAVAISVLITSGVSDEVDTDTASPSTRASQAGQADPSQAGQADPYVDRLLNLTWPRRDENWYKRRWEATHMRCPFGTATSDPNSPCKSSPNANDTNREIIPGLRSDSLVWEDDSLDTADDDGSTFPGHDSFNWKRKPSELPKCSVKEISEALSSSSNAETNKNSIEENLASQKIGLKKNSPSYYHQKGFRKTDPKAKKMAQQGFRMDHATKEITTRLNLNKEDSTFDARWLGDLTDSPYCDPLITASKKMRCLESDPYRSADGSCNNLKNPTWGAAFTPYRRALPPDYEDGVLKPRKAKNGGELPNARSVSKKIHVNTYAESKSYTLLTMAWGQFIDHDITATAQSTGLNGSSLSCCHPAVLEDSSLSHPECFPIRIPDDDEFFRSKNLTCMEFSRSSPASRCLFGPRQQLNQLSHFLDGSVIYGSSSEQQNELRTHEDGLLRTQVTMDGRQLLAPSLIANDSCNTDQQMKWNQFCFVSGDSRVNEHILLTIIHTIWTRHHNILAGELKEINLHWDDERIFQESRKIVIAQIQHITYHEFLPSILGPQLSYGLALSPSFSASYWDKYDDTVHPGIANSFAGSAFRFGHSMIQGLLQSIDASGKNIKFEQLQKYFFNPFALYDPDTISALIRGQVSQSSCAVDTYFTSQVTQHLFQTPGNKHGLDLVSINIQRGRDHGIPSYTRWRMMCGLPAVKNFDDLAPDMDAGSLGAIKRVYSDVDDVDLFTGGLSENPIKDGLVGPTFACIIADQFLRLKKGDRFWYETGPNPQGFTEAQLNEIRKTSLARILCDNVENLMSVQRWPLRQFASGNPRLPCSSKSIPRVELDSWEEGET